MARKNSNLITSVSATLADGSIGLSKLSTGGFTQRKTLSAGQTKIANLDTISISDSFTEVYKNGVLLKFTTDYTIDSDNGITLTSAADANDEITIRTAVDNVASIVGDATVTSAKIVDGAVTNTKYGGTISVDGSGNVTAAGTVSDSDGSLRTIGSTTLISSAPYTIPSGSSGKLFRIDTGATLGTTTVNVNEANFAQGDIFTIFNNTNSDRTVTFDANFTNNVRLAGTDSNFNGVNMTLALFGVATFVAYESDGIAVSGNVS